MSSTSDGAEAKPVAGGRGLGLPHRRISIRDSWIDNSRASETARISGAALLVVRPALLVVALVVGGLMGGGLAGSGDYSATAVVDFTPPATDASVVKQTGQTLALTATGPSVLSASTLAMKLPTGSLDGRASAEWVADTSLLSISVKAATAAEAVSSTNMLTAAFIAYVDADVARQLQSTTSAFDLVAKAKILGSAQAELARVAQLGAALAARQATIVASAGGLAVRSPAVHGFRTGLSRPMGAAIGGVAGILLGALLSLILGLRGLKMSVRLSRRLLAATHLGSVSQTVEFAGRMLESGSNCLAIVVLRGAYTQGASLADNLGRVLEGHGRRMLVVFPSDVAKPDEAADLLREDHRRELAVRQSVDIMIVVAEVNSPSYQLLLGQSSVKAIVIGRNRFEKVSEVLHVLSEVRQAEPILVIVP